MAEGLVERHDERIAGVLSCCGRIVITGTLPGVCHAKGVTAFLYANAIRIFDYPQFAATPRDKVRENAAKVAEAACVSIEYISKSGIRKEDVVAKAIASRGEHPGLVPIISAMEACGAYEPWHDKKTHKTFVRPDSGKCLHYYFYFMDAELGLIYVRVPTWAPFRLQFYCNGIAGWRGSSPPKASVFWLRTTPSCALTIGNAPRNWPIVSRPACSTVSSIATRRCAARFSTCSSRQITGA
jgi:hypothetical protein